MDEQKWLEDKQVWIKAHPITVVLIIIMGLALIGIIAIVHDKVWPPTPSEPLPSFTIGEAITKW